MAYQPEYLLEVINRKRADLTQISVCELRVTSGHIVVCDPLVNPERPALKRTVTPGTYPVEVFVKGYVQDAEYNTVAVAVLRLTSDTVSHLEMATINDQDLQTLGKDEFFGYPVDAGMGCFMDADAQTVFLEANPELGYENWIEYHPEQGNPLNVAMFASGYGDGVYPSFWGLNSSGETVCLITDFQVLE